MSIIGDNIKRIRKSKGLTQEQLGEKCEPKMADSAIRRYESGNSIPKLETVKKIAKALEIDEFLLLQDYDSRPTHEIIEDIYLTHLTVPFRKLNIKGKRKAVEQIELLSKIPEYQEKEHTQN